MKLSLKRILNELKPPGKHSTGQKRGARIVNIMQKVDQGKPEVHKTKDATMHYKGGSLHREDGPAVVPHGAHSQTLEGGTEMVEGGEYYLYGKKASDFAQWYRHVQKLQQQRHEQGVMQPPMGPAPSRLGRPIDPTDTIPDQPGTVYDGEFPLRGDPPRPPLIGANPLGFAKTANPDRTLPPQRPGAKPLKLGKK